ncbi:MAG: hypothetical protein HZA93_29515 [Verrucomicrobia bacterium]|nr:hypothetical protein [Verrucomicrobiota bacterium]
MNHDLIKACGALLMMAVFAACRTVDDAGTRAKQVAKAFASYYADLNKEPGRILHIQGKTPEESQIVEALVHAFPAVVKIKVDGRFRESASGIIDIDTGMDCVAIGISLSFASQTEAVIDVVWNGGPRDWALTTYVLELREGLWKVIGIRKGGVS